MVNGWAFLGSSNERWDESPENIGGKTKKYVTSLSYKYNSSLLTPSDPIT